MPFPPDRRLLPLLPARSRLPARTLLGTLLFMACSGGADLLLPGDGQPAQIALRRGGDQTGRVGEPLADSLVFEVLDSRSRAVEGAQVVFELSSAGPGADVVPDTATTDADGMAKVKMVLGTRIGPQSGEAIVIVPEGTQQPTATFTIMAVAENADGMAAVSGDEQIAPAGSALPQPLVIQVTDAFGNPISGVPITWTAPEGGSVSETSNATDGEGRASVMRTLGPTAGTQTTVATSEGVAGSPVTFTSTATAGSVAGLSIVSGNEQTAEAGTELPGDLVVRLVDAGGNGVPDAAVTWVVGSGGGRVSPENTRTDEAGRTFTRWTLGPSPGANRVDAVVSGVGVVNFTATGTAVAPARLSMVTQPSAAAHNGVRLERQPVVRAQDGRAGLVVTAQLSGGSGELLGTRQRTTGADGSVAFTDLTIAGAEGARSLVFTASGYAGVSSSAIQVQPIATTTTITSDSPDPSVAGGSITVAFQVRSAGPVPVGSVTVTALDGGANCTGVLQNGAGTCQMTLNLVGDRTLRASYSGAPGFLRSSGTAAHRVNPATPGNRPPAADYNSRCQGLTCEFVDRSDDRDGQVTGWSWNFGDGSGPVTQQNPTHTFPNAGRFTVALTVTDNDGASNTATKTVAVEAPPPPLPGGTTTTITGDNPDPSDLGQQITVSFSVTSSSGSPTGTVNVSDERGGGCNGSAPSGSCSYTPSGTGTLTITARYEGNASFNGSSASVEHTVNQPPPPPPAGTTTTITGDGPDPSQPNEQITVSFTVTSSSGSPDGNIRVTDANGGGCTGNAPSGSCSYTPNGTGSRTITATYDGNSNFAGSSDTEEHTVSEPPPPNQPPTAAFSNEACVAGQPCQFTDQSTDDGQIVAWEWQFDDSGGQSTERNPAHTFSAAGVYRVRLRVTDNQDERGEVEREIEVAQPNAPPSAVIGSISCTGLDCIFSDASTDPNGAATIRQWNWLFGDGQTSSEQNPSHQYAATGDYIVTLTVTDDQQVSSGPDQRNVSVGAAPENPGGITPLATTSPS